MLFTATPSQQAGSEPDIPGCTPMRLLGRGGSGEAWLVEQSRPFARQLVAKVFRPEPDAASMLARFERERAAIEALGKSGPLDPGLAPIHDAGIARDGRPYVLMQYIDGVAIDEAARPLDLDSRIALIRQCCVALARAHDAGLVHQDITPSNVLVSRRSDGSLHVTLIDFGLAASSGTRAILHGTPDWMAPEQSAPGASVIAPATDVWALGRLMRHLAGEHRDEKAQTLRALADECMREDQSTRPQHAHALLERLDTMTMQLARARSRRRMRTAVGAMALLALGAAAFGHFTKPRWSGVPSDAVDLVARDFSVSGSAALPEGWEPRNVPNGAWMLALERGGTRRVLTGMGTDGAHGQVAAPLSRELAIEDGYWLEWTMRAAAPANKDTDDSDLFVIVGSGECQLILEPRRDRFVAMRAQTAATRGGVERGELADIGFGDHDRWIRYRVRRDPGRESVLTVERTDLDSGAVATGILLLDRPPSDSCTPAREILLAVQERQPLEIGEIKLWQRPRQH
jgi:hypothetical protein